MATEDHQGVKIPVGDSFPRGESAITPSKGGWPGSKGTGTWSEKNGNGNGGKKSK